MFKFNGKFDRVDTTGRGGIVVQFTPILELFGLMKQPSLLDRVLTGTTVREQITNRLFLRLVCLVECVLLGELEW